MFNNHSASELSFSLRGQLLLASPSLADGTFDHSVIILFEHSAKDGAEGIILNHKTETCVGEILRDKKFKTLHQLPIYHGGPVNSDELSFTALSWNEKFGLRHRSQISAQAAASLIGMPGQLVRASIGHSAWSPGQLESEFTQNVWIARKPIPDLLTLPHDLNLWNELLKSISPYHNLLSQAPKNPLLN